MPFFRVYVARIRAGSPRRAQRLTVREIGATPLQTAKVQRWAPEELLRTLVEAEIAARDAANLRARLRSAAFPVRKSLEELKVQESAVPQSTFEYLASLRGQREDARPLLRRH